MNLLARSLMAAAFATLAVGCTANKSDNTVNAMNAPQIIGGSEVVAGTPLNKSVVAIFDNERGALCTGSLIADNVILTAAHCIGKNPEDHVIIFTTNIDEVFKSNDKNFVLQKVRWASKVLVNPNWGKKHADSEAWGDTALIRFEGTTPAGFAPATLLAPNVLTENMTITVAGYGVSSDVLTEINPDDYPDFQDKLKTGEFFCVSSGDDEAEEGTGEETPGQGAHSSLFAKGTKKAKAKVKGATKAPTAETPVTPETPVAPETPAPAPTVKCYKEEMGGEGILRTTTLTIAGAFNDTEVVFDQQHGQASCEGDSGGPAYYIVNGEYHLFGVTSRGTRGCNGYVLYSDVSSPKLAKWLSEAMIEVSK
jgi:hypothetical protein